MKAASIASVTAFLVVSGWAQMACKAQTIVDSDFSKGSFAALGWKAKGDWDVFVYPKESANNPGAVARFAANKPDGSLTKAFPEIKNPKRLTLSLDYGWGWGDASQGSDAVSFMLLDSRGNGYVFEVHRCKATWAVQWGKVAGGTPARDKTWASEDIDAGHASVRDGGGLSRVMITRESDGAWTITGKDWNKGAARRSGSPTRPRPRSASWSCWGPETSMNRSSTRSCSPERRRARRRDRRAGDRFPEQHRRCTPPFPIADSRCRRRSRWSSTAASAGSGAASRG